MVHLVQPVVPSAKLASAGKRLARAVADGWCLPPVAGGRERQDSVRGGIRALPGDVELILIHDAARPFVSAALISAVLKAADRHGAAIAAIPVQDTVKKSSGDSFISATVDRGSLWLAQTPQAFRAEVIREAHRWAQAIVPGSPLNMKITTGDDIRIARALAGGMA
jgi:2-C-methyl-D-erythritol 4-phosphate cytidylyltransferase